MTKISDVSKIFRFQSTCHRKKFEDQNYNELLMNFQTGKHFGEPGMFAPEIISFPFHNHSLKYEHYIFLAYTLNHSKIQVLLMVTLLLALVRFLSFSNGDGLVAFNCKYNAVSFKGLLQSRL